MNADRAEAIKIATVHYRVLGWEAGSWIARSDTHPVEFEDPPRWAVIDAEGTKFYAETEDQAVQLACILDALEVIVG